MLDEYEENAKIAKHKVFGIFVVLLTISILASTLASTIRINSSNRVEFGQGIYNLKACDSFVNLNLRSGSGANLTKVKFLDLGGFDKIKCKNKYFTIKVQKNGTDLNLFEFQSLTASDCSVTNKVNATVSVVDGKCVIKFTATGSATLPTGVSTFDYLVVGGGGSGGNNRGGGGGAGAFVTANGVSISNRNISATVGTGGSAVSSSGNTTPAGNDGNSSSLTFNSSSNISAAGGGGGGSHASSSGSAPEPGRDGGSGGGASMNYFTLKPLNGAALNSNYGNNGGLSSASTDSNRYTGGGGGAGAIGKNGSSTQTPDGGIGRLDFFGNYVAAGGGGADGRGGTATSPAFCETAYGSSGGGTGGTGGGGRGELACENLSTQTKRTATSGQANTGSGGGGGVNNASGAGGSGVVQVRFTPSSWTSSNKLVLHVSNDSNPIVSLVYTYGASIGDDIPESGDDYQVLTYSSGVYTVEFLQPLVLVADVTGTTFESADSYA